MDISKKKNRRQEQKEGTRKKLIEAFIDCLVELGYPATSIPEIARRAGVAQDVLGDPVDVVAVRGEGPLVPLELGRGLRDAVLELTDGRRARKKHSANPSNMSLRIWRSTDQQLFGRSRTTQIPARLKRPAEPYTL